MRHLLLAFYLCYFCFLPGQTSVIPLPEDGKVGTIYDDPVLLNGQVYSGIINDHYPDGKLRLWVELKEGRADGEWIEWHPNGNVRFRAYWKAGKGEGQWRYFDELGRLTEESFVIADRYHGPSRSYYPNGQLQSESFYENNRQEGYVTKFGPSGEILSRERYEAGRLVVDRPRLFADGMISTAEHQEWVITFTASSDTLILGRRTAGEAQQRLFFSYRKDGQWTAPLELEQAEGRNETPHFSLATEQLIYASSAPLPGVENPDSNDFNLWIADWKNGQIIDPRPWEHNLVRTGSDWPYQYESGPTTDPQGNLYYWSAQEGRSDADLFYARFKDGRYQAPTPLGTNINTPKYESSPTISPDGQLLVFSRYGADDGFGQEDLYLSTKTENGWSTPRNLGPGINSTANEYFAQFSPDGKLLYFSSDRARPGQEGGQDNSSIYYLETRFILDAAE